MYMYAYGTLRVPMPDALFMRACMDAWMPATRDPRHPIFLNTGSAGNIEVCDGWLTPRPAWSVGLQGGPYQFGFAAVNASGSEKVEVTFVSSASGEAIDYFEILKTPHRQPTSMARYRRHEYNDMDPPMQQQQQQQQQEEQPPQQQQEEQEGEPATAVVTVALPRSLGLGSGSPVTTAAATHSAVTSSSSSSSYAYSSETECVAAIEGVSQAMVDAERQFEQANLACLQVRSYLEVDIYLFRILNV
jgi:hypothetical protein